MLLTVITGSNHMVEDNKKSNDDHNTHIRGQCHLLLVGDPGKYILVNNNINTSRILYMKYVLL